MYRNHIDAGRLLDEFTCKMKTRQFVPRVRTPRFVRELEDLINHDPGRSMRSLAEAMNTSHVTIQACVEEDIKYRYYALCKGQFMSEKRQHHPEVVQGEPQWVLQQELVAPQLTGLQSPGLLCLGRR